MRNKSIMCLRQSPIVQCLRWFSLFTQTAIFVFFPAAAGAGRVASDLHYFSSPIIRSIHHPVGNRKNLVISRYFFAKKPLPCGRTNTTRPGHSTFSIVVIDLGIDYFQICSCVNYHSSGRPSSSVGPVPFCLPFRIESGGEDLGVSRLLQTPGDDPMGFGGLEAQGIQSDFSPASFLGHGGSYPLRAGRC